MKETSRAMFGSAIVLAIVVSSLRLGAQEDVLELANGKVLKGTFAGGTTGTVRFQTKDGQKIFTRDEVTTITFSKAAAAAATAPSPAPSPSTPSARTLTVPAGTLLLVKMVTGVSSDDSAGRRFQTQLQNALEANGRVAVLPGTTVTGRIEKAKKAGRLAGKSTLQLTLTELNLGGKAVPIVTGDFAEAGASSFKKTARNAGLGAAIGGAFDGGEGAAKGAAIGAATAVIRKGESVTVPPGAVLEFRLTQPLTVAVTG